MSEHKSVSLSGELVECGRHGSDSNQIAILVEGHKVVRVFGLSDQETKALATRLYSRITLEFIPHV